MGFCGIFLKRAVGRYSQMGHVGEKIFFSSTGADLKSKEIHGLKHKIFHARNTIELFFDQELFKDYYFQLSKL